jgi:hypothetical protein
MYVCIHIRIQTRFCIHVYVHGCGHGMGLYVSIHVRMYAHLIERLSAIWLLAGVESVKVIFISHLTLKNPRHAFTDDSSGSDLCGGLSLIISI